MKLSVIVPVYNVEEYIYNCLDSLVKQTLKDIEIIVINDGSKDNSEAIIKEFQTKYKNIEYYKKPNGGLSDARNYGLKYARGEYIAFLDSDDYTTYDMYEKMYDKAKEKDYDIVTCDVEYIYPDKTKIVRTTPKKSTTNIKKTMIDIYPAAWNKIYKRTLFESGIRFKKGVWYEDVEFLYRLLPYVKSIGVVHKPFHKYVQRDGSIMRTVNKKIYDHVYNMNGLIDFYKENKIYEEYKKELEYVYVRYVFATFVKSVVKYEYKDYMEALDFDIANVNEHFPNYKKNSYFLNSLKGVYLVLFNKRIGKLLYKIKH